MSTIKNPPNFCLKIRFMGYMYSFAKSLLWPVLVFWKLYLPPGWILSEWIICLLKEQGNSHSVVILCCFFCKTFISSSIWESVFNFSEAYVIQIYGLCVLCIWQEQQVKFVLHVMIWSKFICYYSLCLWDIVLKKTWLIRILKHTIHKQHGFISLLRDFLTDQSAVHFIWLFNLI